MIRECAEVFHSISTRAESKKREMAIRTRTTSKKRDGKEKCRWRRSCACKARHRGPTVLPRAASLSCIRRARPTSVSRAQSATPRAHCALPRCVTLAQAESDTDTSLMHSKRDTAGPHFSLTSCSVSRFRMTILSSVSHSDKARAKGPACRTPSQNR